MIAFLMVLAGGVGALCRFQLDGFVSRHNPFRLPLGTLLINITGSLILGLLTGWVLYGHGGQGAGTTKLVLGTGFCGGFTTYSTAAVETVRIWQTDGQRRGVGYALLTLVLSVAAAAVGLTLGWLI